MRLKGRAGASTSPGPKRQTHLFSSVSRLSSLPSCGLADSLASPYHFLTTLCNGVPWVGFDPISTRATGDGVLAPIHRTDVVVATSTLAFVGAAAQVQRVAAAPSVDAVRATIAVDSVTIRGAYKGVGSVVALDGSPREPGVGVLGYPAYLLELSAGMQRWSFHVQIPHQTVAAGVGRMPIRVESSLEGVGCNALP